MAPSDKIGGLHGKDQFHDTVEELIIACDLNDIKPKTGRYTWSNNKVGSTNILAHLGQFLVHNSRLDGNFMISSKIFPKLSSEHHPISLLFEKEENLGPIPFRFSPLWVERDGFFDVVAQAWSLYVDGSPRFIWE